MKQAILNALSALNISDYSMTEQQRSSAELFFIKSGWICAALRIRTNTALPYTMFLKRTAKVPRQQHRNPVPRN